MCGVERVGISAVGGNVSTVETGTTAVGDSYTVVGGGVGLGTFAIVGDDVPAAGSPLGEQAHNNRVQKRNARRILSILR